MESVLNLLGVFFTVFALGACAMAKGAPSEIEGLLLMLTAAVFYGAAAVVGAIGKGPLPQRQTRPIFDRPREDRTPKQESPAQAK